jgi:hypothetical protein
MDHSDTEAADPEPLSTETGEDPPRCTLRHLRADDQSCARRIVKEMYQRRDTKRNFGSSRAFDLSARLLGDIALAHAELRAATTPDFPLPADLSGEERSVYRAAALGYVTVFREPFVLDPLPDEWESRDCKSGLRWSARVPLAGRDANGVAHVRHVSVDHGTPDIDEPTLFMLALRTEGWAEAVTVDVASLLAADRRDPVLIDAATRDAARRWANHRAARWTTIGTDPRPRVGRDCLGCSYVAACPGHS